MRHAGLDSIDSRSKTHATAIFAANDLSALVTLDVAAELGVDVPDRLSVVGFDNIPESALADTPLTTVEQPIRRMGHDAIDMLTALIRGESARGVPRDRGHQARASAGRPPPRR